MGIKKQGTFTVRDVNHLTDQEAVDFAREMDKIGARYAEPSGPTEFALYRTAPNTLTKVCPARCNIFSFRFRKKCPLCDRPLVPHRN